MASETDWRQSLEESIRKGDPTWSSEPIFNEATGSYYQLARDVGLKNGINWETANAKAQRLSFKGRKGRLAVIDTPELSAWLNENFPLNGVGYGGNTWIGLRYWCRFRQLSWSNSEVHPFNAFSIWDNPWYYRDEVRCGHPADLPWMGVYIVGDTMRWRAVGFRKVMMHYLVEYPAPQSEDTAKNNIK
ncbi:hypothetical protein GCM10007972_01870 [Iodidimonas muriae]|uniref:Uncharacterized protein n=1 Tax=Iodidimonas muriae TaxID=261467 RepID=A0ABQ2L6B4_9PROT|nr:C-type lectin domain-containing protein [Iodidimonas muriae]GER06484.1 hypothetical protein JCM17843_07940 [Kordiimonadales bacterium JCM 17843]GGO04965.1 hypothetical protein GCM10007972_01870 [Iodidimonas muriae]